MGLISNHRTSEIVLKFWVTVSQASVRTSEGVELTSRNAAVRSLDILSGAAADHDSLASDNEQAIFNAIRRPSILPSNVMQAVIGVKFIADHLKQQDEDDRVSIPHCQIRQQLQVISVE
jgi:hypothetical protein